MQKAHSCFRLISNVDLWKVELIRDAFQALAILQGRTYYIAGPPTKAAAVREALVGASKRESKTAIVGGKPVEVETEISIEF